MVKTRTTMRTKKKAKQIEDERVNKSEWRRRGMQRDAKREREERARAITQLGAQL